MRMWSFLCRCEVIHSHCNRCRNESCSFNRLQWCLKDICIPRHHMWTDLCLQSACVTDQSSSSISTCAAFRCALWVLSVGICQQIIRCIKKRSVMKLRLRVRSSERSRWREEMLLIWVMSHDSRAMKVNATEWILWTSYQESAGVGLQWSAIEMSSFCLSLMILWHCAHYNYSWLSRYQAAGEYFVLKVDVRSRKNKEIKEHNKSNLKTTPCCHLDKLRCDPRQQLRKKSVLQTHTLAADTVLAKRLCKHREWRRH